MDLETWLPVERVLAGTGPPQVPSVVSADAHIVGSSLRVSALPSFASSVLLLFFLFACLLSFRAVFGKSKGK